MPEIILILFGAMLAIFSVGGFIVDGINSSRRRNDTKKNKENKHTTADDKPKK